MKQQSWFPGNPETRWEMRLAQRRVDPGGIPPLMLEEDIDEDKQYFVDLMDWESRPLEFTAMNGRVYRVIDYPGEIQWCYYYPGEKLIPHQLVAASKVPADIRSRYRENLKYAREFARRTYPPKEFKQALGNSVVWRSVLKPKR